ncbi:unnamed protein product, partial [Vitis vinifera]
MPGLKAYKIKVHIEDENVLVVYGERKKRTRKRATWLCATFLSGFVSSDPWIWWIWWIWYLCKLMWKIVNKYEFYVCRDLCTVVVVWAMLF